MCQTVHVVLHTCSSLDCIHVIPYIRVPVGLAKPVLECHVDDSLFHLHMQVVFSLLLVMALSLVCEAASLSSYPPRRQGTAVLRTVEHGA